jgi:hypothetical protein
MDTIHHQVEEWAMDHCHVCGSREHLRWGATKEQLEAVQFQAEDTRVRLVCHDCLETALRAGLTNPHLMGERGPAPRLPAVPRRRGRLERQAGQDRPAIPPHALVVAGRFLGALCGRRALRLSPACPQGRRNGPEEAGQPQRLPRRHRLLDVYDFHAGSSDLPVWAADSKSVFYTAKVGSNVELFRVALDGKNEQLTETAVGSMHYLLAASPDGKWLVYGSKRDGVRQLYVMRLSDKKEHRITDLKKGHAAMWAH